MRLRWGFSKKAIEIEEKVINELASTTKGLKQRIEQQSNLSKQVLELKNQVTSYQNEFGINIKPNIHAGEVVTIKSAFGLDTVYSCIRDKAESIGQLPVIVKRNGKKLGRGNRDYRILAQKPNDYMTMQDLLEMFVTCIEARGNFYMYPLFNKYGNLSQLIPFRYQENIVPNMDSFGNVYYTYVTNDGKPNITFAGGNIAHIKLNSLNGISGLSPISTTASTYGIAIAQESHLESLMSESAMPKGVLHTDNVFDDDNVVKRLGEQWSENYGGARKSGKTPILEHGLKYQPIGLSPADSELIKQRTFSRLQICSIFRVPPQRMGIIEAQKFKTLEETNKSYLKDSLVPLITKFENCINGMLPDSLVFEIDVNKYSRGDRPSMVKSSKDEFSTGAISMNEMREDLGREPIEGGDVHAIDTNNFTFGKLTDIEKLQEENRMLARSAAQANQVATTEEGDENAE